ncbi:MAG: hypothetical protein NVS9B8_00660 [Candidatus Limnocylindrales bacterium]
MASQPDSGGLAGLADDLRPMADTADALLERRAEAVRMRVAGRRAAEARLASFAFAERAPSDRSRWPSPGPDDSPDLGYFIRCALGALGDPDTVRILYALRAEDQALAALMGVVAPAIRDRLVASDRIGGLASAGLVGRDLESDRVALTPLGMALLDLVAELERRTQRVRTR